MSNVIPMRVRCEPPGPYQAASELHGLYERLSALRADAQAIAQRLGREPCVCDATVVSPPAVLEQVNLLMETAADQILDVASQLIVEAIAALILSPTDAKDQST